MQGITTFGSLRLNRIFIGFNYVQLTSFTATVKIMISKTRGHYWIKFLNKLSQLFWFKQEIHVSRAAHLTKATIPLDHTVGTARCRTKNNVVFSQFQTLREIRN